MPLIIVSGFPCCGKTTFCFQLEAYLKEQGIAKIVVINEETENIDKRLGYLDAFNEKKTRGALKSAIDHALDAETFVILDSMNYIKGYRYELFCIARSLRTPHCCVWIQSDEDLAVKWNQSRSAQGYEDAM
jgi:protein KTI12